MTEPSNYSAIKNALEIFSECIKNGNEIKNLCEKCTNATIKSHPIFKKLIEKIQADTKAIEKLKSKVDELMKSVENNNYQKWRVDMGEVINSLETASHDTIKKISHAIAASGTKQIKKKFEENERIFSDSDITKITDETVKNFTKVVSERNQKIVECLKYAHSLLPKFFKLQNADDSQKSFRKRRKLFIIGEDLSKSLTNSKKYERIGDVTIKNHSPNSTSLSKSNMTDIRQNLNGYLIDDSEKTEVLLKLKEPVNGSFNLMDFSKTSNFDSTKLSATIEIGGEIDEDVEIIEININEDFTTSKRAEALAVVENIKTGSFNHVPIQIVPKSPEKAIHGKIVEIQQANNTKNATENLEDIEIDLSGSVFNSTFNFNSSGKLPHYATPSRKVRNANVSAMSQYYTPVRRKRENIQNDGLRDVLNQSANERSIREDNASAINQLVENVTGRVLNAILNDPQNNLDDVSEIEYAEMSSMYDKNNIHQNPNNTIRSPQRRYESPQILQSPVRRINRQPAEGMLIDIQQTPPHPIQRQNIPFRGGNLIQFDDEEQSSPRRQMNFTSVPNQSNERLRELVGDLTDLLNESLPSRMKRREKVHDRSLPYRNGKSARILNTSLPAKMPIRSNNASFRRPVQAVPARIPEDAPVQMTSVVVSRPREELSPLRQHETQRVNRMLENTMNPFTNEMFQAPATSNSFYEHHNILNNMSYNDRNASLPSHLTPKKEQLPAMDRSLMTAWQEMQAPQISVVEDEILQNISDPYSSSMNDTYYGTYQNLADESSPFSDSLNELINSYDQNIAQSFPIQSVNDFISRFKNLENLENVSMELFDDEKDLF